MPEVNCHNLSFFQFSSLSVTPNTLVMNLCFFSFLASSGTKYSLILFTDKKIPGDAATCGKILTESKFENWLLGRTKVFLKYYHVEELARLLELYRRKVVTLQTGWFMFMSCWFMTKLCCFKITFHFRHR